MTIKETILKIMPAIKLPFLDTEKLAKILNGEEIVTNSLFKSRKYTFMTGLELLSVPEPRDKFFVGRNGGITGVLFTKDDLENGGWKTQKYATNRDVQVAPNRNWFSLTEFVSKVKALPDNG